MSTPAQRVRAPRPGLVHGWMLVTAGLLASPALWLLGEGLVTTTDALMRYLIVLAACVAVSLGVRAVWPVLSGEPAKNEPPGPTHEESDRADQAG